MRARMRFIAGVSLAVDVRGWERTGKLGRTRRREAAAYTTSLSAKNVRDR
jgi:hypothetical protein